MQDTKTESIFQPIEKTNPSWCNKVLEKWHFYRDMENRYFHIFGANDPRTIKANNRFIYWNNARKDWGIK